MLKNKTLLKEIWNYLIVFSVIILAILWFLQVVFLETYYVWIKTNDMNNVSSQIKKAFNSEDFYEKLDNLAYTKDICINIVYGQNSIYSSGALDKNCLGMEDDNYTYQKFILDFMNTNKDSIKYKLVNNRFKNQMFLMGLKLDEEHYAFISTSIEPLGATTNILISQLIYVTFGVLIFSLLISYFISKKISKPIIKMNEQAKKLSKRDYSVDFKVEKNISEIVELSNTLNSVKEELEKTDIVRRELMANISHDLKTPLTMIKAYAEMVRDLTYKDEEKRNENLNTIIFETDRLNLLVNDILELSKIQSGKSELEIDEFDLNSTIIDIIKRFECFQDIDFIYKEKSNLKVRADKKKIEQVIYNLLSNAVNHVGKDNKVIIKITDKKSHYLVSIIDHGFGIEENELKNIWDKYYKLDKTHKRSSNGTGLGLSIVKSILEAHKFEYGVESKLNKGTTFYFEISK